jgi:hypothetical protein
MIKESNGEWNLKNLSVHIKIYFMRFFFSTVLIFLMAYLMGMFIPWWGIVIAAFLGGVFIRQKPLYSFLSGFLALLLLWGGMSLWISIQNEHILAGRMAPILFKKDSPLLLVGVTAVVGALMGGLGALTGRLTRNIIHSQEA